MSASGLIIGCTTLVSEIDAFITEAGNDARKRKKATSVVDASMDNCMSKFTLDVKSVRNVEEVNR